MEDVMKIVFCCKRSGNKVAFTNESDIEQMRKHECYDEVKDDSAVPAEQPPEAPKKPRGRPRKEQ
jgi:hypothetical protein